MPAMSRNILTHLFQFFLEILAARLFGRFNSTLSGFHGLGLTYQHGHTGKYRYHQHNKFLL